MKKVWYPFPTFTANLHLLSRDGVQASWCTNSFGDMRRPHESRGPFVCGNEGLMFGVGSDFGTPSAPGCRTTLANEKHAQRLALAKWQTHMHGWQ